jgi:molecular chaperone DnaK
MANDNRQLGIFKLDGIPPAPRGMPQVEVTFDIDANGILHVSAKDLGTGKEQQIRIEASSGLEESEIDRMVKEAETNADADRARSELVDTRNRAEQLVLAVEKPLAEAGEKLPADVKGRVESALEGVREANKGDDRAAIDAAVEALQAASQEMSAKLYESTAGAEGPGPEGPPPGGPESGGDDDVIDAEYEDAR